jgi:phosphoribosylformylglycinamidine synthase
VVTTSDPIAILDAAESVGLVAVALGETEGTTLTFRSVGGETSTDIGDLRASHEAFFRDWMDA